MAPPICLRCLTRTLFLSEPLPPQRLMQQAAAFSTTSPSLATNRAGSKQATSSPPSRGGGPTLRLKKNARTRTANPPAPGERKAFRKKIVLSNNNALEIPGLEDLTADQLEVTGGQLVLESSEGRILGITPDAVNALRALETFNPTQGWNMFRRPATLIRAETIRMAKDIIEAENDEEASTHGQLIFGEQGSGKSVMLLQAQAMAMARGWVVIHIPDANEVTNGQTSYEPQQTEDGLRYSQPQYLARLLKNTARANDKVLQKMTLSQKHNLPISVQPNISLARFAELGADDPDLAWPVWTALWTELIRQSQPQTGLQRPPILFSADGADHMMRQSAYIDAATNPIHPFDLSLVAHFTKVLSGETRLPNGGMALGAISQGNRAATPTFNYYLDLRHFRKDNWRFDNSAAVDVESSQPSQLARLDSSRQISQSIQPLKKPRWDRFRAKDTRVQEIMKRVRNVVKLEGLSKPEARGILEYYAQSGLLRGSVTDVLVSEKWSLASNGIVGHIERSSIRMGV